MREYEARIDLSVDKYCSKRPYRCSVEDKNEIEEQISKLLEKKLIEVSYSPFAAPVTLVFKKEDKKRSRLCIDFRDLNKIIVPQAQPFPLIDDLVIKTRNCNYFSTLDINSEFWSIPLRMEDCVRDTGRALPMDLSAFWFKNSTCNFSESLKYNIEEIYTYRICC